MNWYWIIHVTHILWLQYVLYVLQVLSDEVLERSGDDLDQSEDVMSPDLDDDGKPKVKKKRKRKKKVKGADHQRSFGWNRLLFAFKGRVLCTV